MSIGMSLEQRLTAVEAAIFEIQKQLGASQSIDWLQQIKGSFKNEPAFEEVLAYGRAVRQADQPSPDTHAEL